MVILMKIRMVNTSVQDTSAKAFVYEYIVNRVTKSRTIRVLKPSSWME